MSVVSVLIQPFFQRDAKITSYKGTIKHAQLAAIEHNRIVIARYRAKAGAPVAYQDSYEDYLRASETTINNLKD
ncbi:hypothetical protein MPER_05315 [Moniliophthora perniciosa FA553]|nr:hypothetical protein MPER_05315 [Moniliophthora perniciosa FA553]